MHRNVSILGEVFSELVTAIWRDNEARMVRMSAFVGHLTNAVFLHIGAGFLATLNVQSTGLQFWTTLIAGVGLRLMAIVFLFRLAEVISQWLQATLRKVAVAFTDERAVPNPPNPLVSGFSTVALIVLLNIVTYSFSTAVGDFAKSQIPTLEDNGRSPPAPGRAAPHIPSCYHDQCRA